MNFQRTKGHFSFFVLTQHYWTLSQSIALFSFELLRHNLVDVIKQTRKVQRTLLSLPRTPYSGTTRE